MPRSRGIATRAASALLFCAAALAALVFPEGAAGGRDVGFAPGQVPFDLLLIPGEDSPGVNPDDPRFDRGELCGELGGTLQDADQEEVCGGIDANDTFCIPGSAAAFPCRGLYKHVIVCNAGYNRPALNPFFCGAACQVGQQARGANCERVVTPAEAATFSPTLHVAEGHSGAVAAVTAKAGVTLDFSPAADWSFILLPPPAEERDYAVLFPPPGFGAGLEVSLTARIVCAGCYPSRLTVIASLLPVRAPEQPSIAAVFGESFAAAPAAPGDYAGATLALAAAAAAGFSLESGTLTSSAGGGPDAGIYAVTVGATDSGFAGTLALVISAVISRQPLPEEAWGLRAGDERASVTVAAGYPLPFHRAASRHTLAALVLPAPIAGLRTALTGTVAAFYADLSAGVLNTTAALTVRHRSDASSGKRNYADLAQTVAVWVSVVAAPAQGSFQATASAEIAGVSLAAPDFAAGEFLDLDPADEFNIGADGVVSGTPTQDALYELAAGWTTAGMLGTLTLAFQMIVGEGKIINPDDVVAVRTVERSAAAGFSGAGWTVTAAAGYTLDFRGEENSYDGHTVRALAGGKWALELTTALESEGRTVAARARALCGVCLAGQFVTVTAVFAAVLAPGQATLAGVYGEDGAAHELTPPANYATGGTFAVVGVSGPGGGFVVDGTGAGLARDSSDTPNAGLHVVSVAMTHPGFLGSLTLEVTANIARKIPSDVAGLSPQGRTTVTAAFGHTGEVFHLTLANGDYEFGRYDFSTINAGSVAALAKETDGIDDADRELTAAELLAEIKYLFGLTLAASADRLTLSAALTAALAEGEALPPADGTSFMLVYAQRRDGSPNFTDYGKFVFYRIETLDEPPVAGLRRTGPLAAGTALFDFSAGSYANGDYAGAVFSELGGAGGAAALDAAADGTAAVARELTAPGYYAITVLAASPEGADFVGTARLTLSLTLSRAIDLDAAVWPRVIVTAAARGFYGRGASFSVSTGYVVENPRYDFPSGQFAYDESSRTFVIPASSPLGVLAVTAAVTAEVGCARAEDLCDARAVTVTAIFNPVADPGQGTVTAIYGESFGRAARPPTGYETGGRFALLGVGGVDSAGLSAISLRVDSSGGLTLDVAGGVGGALSAGTVTATIGMTHPDFLGTVALRTRLEILPAHPGALYALSAAERNPGVVTVAAGWRGVAHRAELGAAAAGGGIVLPAESPRNVSLALSGDGRTVSFALSSPLDGGAEFAETIALTVTRNDLNYYDIGQTVELRVSALAVPAAVNRDGAGSPTNPFRSGNLHDFGQGVYAGAVFGKKSGADELRVSESGVVSVIPAGIGTSGSYVMVITATSGAFLGAAEFEFALDVGELGGLPGLYGVPPTARTERRKVAAGYTGSVAFFAASTVGVTLRTPDSSPAGFDFETEADFVSPGGFAVSLTLALSAGGAIGGAFEVAGQYAGYSDATIPLLVTIEALASPPLADTGGARTAPVSGDIFDFAGSDYADGDYQGASFRAAGGASSDLTVSARGQVSTARELGAGVYGVTVLAEGSSEYLGTATLSLALTVRWVLEYGTDSGVGEVGAVDASGAVLTSGAQLSANARLTLRATPSDSHYVSGWTGACGGNVGGIGSAETPGEAQDCGLTAADNVRVRAVFSPAAVPAADGIAEGERVRRARTAAGYTGSVAFFAAAAEGATLRTPVLAPVGFGFSGSGLDFVSPAGFAVSLLASPGAGKAATASFEAVASFRDYAETGITLRVEVSVLESPSPQSGRRAVGSGERLSAGGLHDFGVGDYAGAVFGKQSGAAALTVSEFGVVSAQDAAAGFHTIVMTATSAAFLGVAEFRYELEVAAPTAPLPAGDGVPPGARTVTVTVAAGHTGSVAFFAAAVSGAVLRTPALAPAGFGFETETDFVSPAGFAVWLTTALAPGGARGGSFEVAASRAGFTEARITLSATVTALASAPLADAGIKLAPFSGTVFNFADAGYADGVYDGARFSEGGELSADLDVDANGRVSVSAAGSLSAGVYGMTVLAAGDLPDYLGTATLTLRLTVGWRVEYGGDPAGGGEVTAVDENGSALASVSVAAPGARITFRAAPSLSHYVSGWTGACGGDVGGVGSADSPGVAQTCALAATANINVTANFGESTSAALFVFNGAGVRATGDMVVVEHAVPYDGRSDVVTLTMRYHGTQRRLDVMRLIAWGLSTLEVPTNGYLNNPIFASYGLAARTCKGDGWRVPTVGEVAGAGYNGFNNPLPVNRAGGAGNLRAESAAGALKGLRVPMPSYDRSFNIAEVGNQTPGGFYELDSRDVNGNYVPVRYHGAVDIRFPTSTANRWIMCVRDAADNTEKAADLAAVLLESDGQTVGDPVDRGTGEVSASPLPSFTVAATLRPSAAAGAELFRGTVYSWKHKDAPEILTEARPLVAAAALAAGYDVVTTAAAGDSGTEIRILVGSPRPAAVAGRTTLFLRASHVLGVSATIAVEVEVLDASEVLLATYTGEAGTGGALSAALSDGTAVASGGEAAYGQDLHVTATPEAGYYVLSWGGDCAGSAAGAAGEEGEAKTCVVAIASPTVSVGVLFGRDECAAVNAPSPCDVNATCTDTDHSLADSAEPVMCECDAGYSSRDNGRTCVAAAGAPLPAGDGVPPGARTVTLTVAGGYAGELTVFAAAGAGVTLRTPDSSPAGFVFETGADFVSPGSFAISLSSALAAGETREGLFEVTASRAGNSATRIGLAVIVSALSSAPLAGVGLQVAPYSSDNIFDFADTVYADGVYGGAHFSEAGALSADLDVSAGGRVSASSLGGGVYGVTVAAGRSPYYLGTATLTLRLTVGWRVEYGGDPAGDGEVTAADASGSALASGSVAAPGAAVTFRATPSSGRYVSGWTGACGGASRPGQIGSAARPGESRACGLTVSAHINVTANFAEGGSDLTIFNGAVVTATGQVVSVTLNNITVSSAANNLSVNMAYHGVLRNLHVMRLARWLIGASGITGGTGEFPGAHFRNVGIAAGVCGRDGWRVPTVGEIVGLSKSGAGPETVGRVAGPSSDYNVAPAGAAVGLSVSLPPAGGDDNADSLPDDRYELDSRDVGGAYAVVRYHSGFSDVRFPKTTADRKVICVKDAGNAADSPDLAAVRLESGGEIAGNPVASSTNPSPSFTVTATLSVSHSFGDGLFTGTVQAWKHKDAPVILSGSRPLVTAASGLAAGYDIVITAAAGDSGTEVMVKVGSPPPLAIAGLTTLSLRAAAKLGVTANIEVVVEVMGGQQFEAHYAAESVRGGVTIGGLSATLRGGGAVAPGGRANRGEDLHVTATPEADYYVVSWTGACAGMGSSSAGEAKTCVLATDVQTASVTFGAVFGRDECAASVSPCGENASCSVDPDHLAANSAVELECSCDSGFADDGSGFCAEIDVGDLIARGEREVLAYVSPTYTGSVAFFRAQDGATLRTPSSAPAGFAFATDTEFAAPAGVVVSMASSLHDGGYRTGVFVVTAEASGVSRDITLRVNVNALNRLNSSWGGLAGDSGRLERLSVPGFSGARFFRDSSSVDSQLTLSIDGEVGAPAPLTAGVGASREQPSYELELSGYAEHDGFLGRLPFSLTGEVCTVPETLTDFSAGGQIIMEAIVREYSLNGDPDLRQLACEAVYAGGSPSAALHSFVQINRPRGLGLLLDLNADVNNYLFESGTALDIALEIGAIANAPVLRRAGGGCVLYEGHRGAECASEHSDYAGLPQVPASSIVAPELRNVTITLGQLSPTQFGWRLTVALMTVSSAANFPDPARRVLLRPLGSDSGRVRGETKRVRNLRKTTGREVVLTPFYPGPGGVFRDFFHVQGVQNGKRPGRATIALTYEALPSFRATVGDTTPGASFFDLRSFPELSDAELFELDDDPGLSNIVASTPGFSVAANGMVSGPDDFSDPATVFFLARSSSFAGWAYGRLDVNSQVAAQDHDLLIAERNPRLTVLTGHTGVVYPFQTYRLFELGYDLLFEETGAVFADGGLERVWANLLIPEGRPMTLGETRTAEMTVGVDCPTCALDEKLTVTAVFVPLELSAPAQGRFTVTINQPEQYFKFPLNLPPGYGPNEGATTYVEDSGYTSIFNAHRESGFLSYQCAPAIRGCKLVGWPFPGTYVVPVIFENESMFVGRLTLSVTVQVVGQPLGDLGVPESELRTTVWVHPGFSGAVHRVTTASAETFLKCGARVYPAGFERTYDCEFILTPGVGDRSVTVVLEESRPWYATRTVTAELHVKELSSPPVARISGEAPVFASVVAHDFASADYAGGVYAGAEFSERPPSSALGARQNGEIYAKETLFEGRHGLTVLAAGSPGFRGSVLLTVELELVPPSKPGVPAAQLDVTVYAAGGYEGELHRLVAADPRTALTCAAATKENIELTPGCAFFLRGGDGARRGIFDFSQTPNGGSAEMLRATLEARVLSPQASGLITLETPEHRGEADFVNLGAWETPDGRAFSSLFPDARFSLFADDAGVVSVSADGRARLSRAGQPRGRYTVTVHAVPLRGEFLGTAAFSVVARVSPPPKRVLAADSIPESERNIVIRVPFDDGALTLWKAKARNSSVMISVVQRVNDRDFFNIADSGADIVGGDLGDLTYNGAANEIQWDPHDKVGGGLDFAFWARAERAGDEWLADEFIVRIQLSDLEKVPARNAAFDVTTAAGRVLMTLFPPGFSDAVITESLDAATLFAVSANGAVSLSGAGAPTAGLRTLIARARDDAGKRGYKRFHGDILLTARIRFLNAGDVAFVTATVSEGGGGVSVSAPDRHGRAVALGAAYRGVRRGLHWMESTAGVSRLDVYSPEQRGRHEQFCAAGGEMNGKRWRVPTVGEVAGVLTAGDGPAVLTENNRIWQIPGAASGMAIRLPSAPRGGDNNLEGEAFVVAGWERNAGGQAAPIIYDGGGTKTTLGGHFRLSETIGRSATMTIVGPVATMTIVSSGTMTMVSSVTAMMTIGSPVTMTMVSSVTATITMVGPVATMTIAGLVCDGKNGDGAPVGYEKIEGKIISESLLDGSVKVVDAESNVPCAPVGVNPRLVCVLEKDESYSPVPPLLGVRLEGGGRVLAGGAATLRTPAVPELARTGLPEIFLQSGPVLTVTASAWRTAATPSFRAAARDEPDALLTGAFSGAGLTADFSSLGGKALATVRLTAPPAFALERRVFTLSFAPEFGATVSLAVTVQSRAPPVSDEELTMALPLESRTLAFRAVPGYSGALVTLSSSDSRFTLAPPTGDLEDGFGIERVGGNYVLTVSEILGGYDSRAATIGTTVSVVGRNSRRTATLSFSVEPLLVPFREPFRGPSEEVGGMTLAVLKAGDFASAVFEKISGDAGLQVVDAQSGVVVAEEREWTEGRYHVVVGARDAGRFFGRASITVSLVVGPVKPVLFMFNRAEVRESGEAVAVRDLLGGDETRADFSMVYRGVRRGLRWMESAAAGSSTHQRELCAAGGRQYGWRVPTASEVAGLLLSGETAEVGGVVPAAENGAAVGARILLAAGAAVSLAGLSDGPFFADFLLGGRAAAARAEDGKLHLSGEGEARYLCVSAAGAAYEIPERIAGIRAEVGGDAQSGGGVFSFRHGRIGAGEVYRVSVFAYNAPLSGLRDNGAASLRAEVLGSVRYTARYESDADAPGAGTVILKSPGFLTEGESSATVRITPLAGAAVTLEITARAESIGERPVAAEDSIPLSERFIAARVPRVFIGLTLWRAEPVASDVVLTVVKQTLEFLVTEVVTEGVMKQTLVFVATATTEFADSFQTERPVFNGCKAVKGEDKVLLNDLAPSGNSNRCLVSAGDSDSDDDAPPGIQENLVYKPADNAIVFTGAGEKSFAFKVRATREPEWEADEFLVHIRLTSHPKVPAVNVAVERASVVGRVLATLSVPGFPGALFSEATDSDNLFTVLPSGAVSLSGSTNPTVGASQLVVAATAAFSDRGYKRFYGRVLVTANIIFVSAEGVGFAGVTVAADGDSADVVLKDEYEREIVTVAATYRGRRRGLHWVETLATVNRRDVFSRPYREFAEQLCAAGGASGGKRWRVATIGEVAGILNSGTGSVTLAENNRFWEIPGAASGMQIPLPTAARGGTKNLSGDAFVVSARDRKGSRVLPVIYEQAANGDAKLGGNNAAEDSGPRYACVLEAEAFSPTPPLLGVRLEGGGRVLAGGAAASQTPAIPGLARAEAPPLMFKGAELTIRATGWNYGVGSQFRVVRVDHPQAVVSMTSSAAPAGFEVEQGEGRVTVRVNFEPDLYRAAMMTVSAWPQFGATVSAVVTLVTGKSAFVGGDALPEADLLAGLPLAARNIRVTVAGANPRVTVAGANPDAGPLGVGYSGAVHSIVVASGSSLELDFAATENGGMSLAADGSVSPLTASLTALSAGEVLTAVFSITAGLAGHRSERVLVSVTAEAVVFQSSRGNFPESLTSGTLLTLRKHSALLADATFARAGASSFLRVSRTGLVSSASSGGLLKRDAAYEMTVLAQNPAVFLGDAYFRVMIEVNDPLFSDDELEAVIPASKRSVRRVALAGYTGEIRHTIVSGDSSVTLDLPSAPVGFSLDSSGRISLAGAFSGAAIEGVFPVTVRKAGRRNAVIPVRAAVGPPQTETMFVAEFVPDTSGDLFDFGAGDLGGAVFTRDSSSDSELALSAEGVLLAPSALAEGTYTLSGSASGGDILGVIPIGASVDVKPLISPVFGGVTLTEKGTSGTRVPVAAEWCDSSTTCKRSGRDTPWFYHGERRGLHWMLSGRGEDAGLGSYVSARVCAWGGTHEGRQWRLPTLGELAGGLASSNAAGFVVLTMYANQSNVVPVAGAAPGLTVRYNAGLATDDGALPALSELRGGTHAYMSELSHHLTGNQTGSIFTPVFTWTPGSSGASLLSSTGNNGRLACVLEAADEYERPPSLLGIRVKSGGEILTGNFKRGQSGDMNLPQEREARVSAPAAVSAAGAVYTLTATAWRVSLNGSGGKRENVNLELPDAPLTMQLSGDSAGASIVLTSVAEEGVRVILEVDAAPTSERVLQLDIWPEFGLTVSIFVTLGVSTSGRAGSPDWEDDESRGGDVLADVLAFSAKAGGVAFAAAGDLERRELEHSGVFNSAATIRGEHSFNYLTSDGRQTRVVSPGSTARDFAHCLGAVSDLMIAPGIVRRRTEEPTERCEGGGA